MKFNSDIDSSPNLGNGVEQVQQEEEEEEDRAVGSEAVRNCTTAAAGDTIPEDAFTAVICECKRSSDT